MFSNKLFNGHTIEPMQESMKMLYRVAAEKRRVTTPSAVGRVMNVSQQRLKNWEARGISKEGALIAQELFGIDSNTLLKLNSAAPAEKITYKTAASAAPFPHRVESRISPYIPAKWPFKTVSPEQWEALSKTQKTAVETVARSYVSVGDNAPHTAQPAPNAAAA